MANTIKLIKSEKPTYFPRLGDLLYDPTTQKIYVLIKIPTLNTFMAKSISDDRRWSKPRKTMLEAVDKLVPLGACEITVKTVMKPENKKLHQLNDGDLLFLGFTKYTDEEFVLNENKDSLQIRAKLNPLCCASDEVKVYSFHAYIRTSKARGKVLLKLESLTGSSWQAFFDTVSELHKAVK